MFTGIITHLGKFIGIKKSVFTFIANPAFCKKISKGTSIAVNGVCLTAFAKPAQNSFSVEVMPETQKKTMLGHLKINDLTNLELPVTPTTLLSGHIVQGHIDGIAKLVRIERNKNSHILQFSIPDNLSKYITEKGSIAVNGISLTIIEAKRKYFIVGIIPYTWKNTMLNTIKIGDFVNIEVDILAKYIEKLLKK
ncbi:riboflavin synthase [Candidatus Daviesbacteria bacterium]|nr:riboflavin synthase [Candidatus Daviesbacteria bacterium]